MSFLFSTGRQPRRDPELEAGLARSRQHLARDINDEKTLAFGTVPSRRRKGSWTIVVAAAFLLAGAFGLLPRLGGAAPGASCDAPYLRLGSTTVAPGALVSWRAGGGDTAQFVAAVDATAIHDTGAGPVPDTGTLITPLFRMVDCAIAPASFAAPTSAGTHRVTLFQRSEGGYAAVASVTLTIRD